MESTPVALSQHPAVPIEPSSVARDDRAADRVAELSIGSARPVDDAGENCYCCSLLCAVACCFLNMFRDLLSLIGCGPPRSQRAVIEFLQRFPEEAFNGEEDLREAFFQGFLQLPTAAQRAARRLVYIRHWNEIQPSEHVQVESKMPVAPPRRLSSQEVVELINNFIQTNLYNPTAREALANFAGIQPPDED
jgi:hypothetical protein